MMVLKEKKEMDDSFKKAQKPWVKILTKVNKTKLDYHNACKAERSATNQERNATGDNAVSPEQVFPPFLLFLSLSLSGCLITIHCDEVLREGGGDPMGRFFFCFSPGVKLIPGVRLTCGAVCAQRHILIHSAYVIFLTGPQVAGTRAASQGGGAADQGKVRGGPAGNQCLQPQVHGGHDRGLRQMPANGDATARLL